MIDYQNEPCNELHLSQIELHKHRFSSIKMNLCSQSILSLVPEQSHLFTPSQLISLLDHNTIFNRSEPGFLFKYSLLDKNHVTGWFKTSVSTRSQSIFWLDQSKGYHLMQLFYLVQKKCSVNLIKIKISLNQNCLIHSIKLTLDLIKSIWFNHSKSISVVNKTPSVHSIQINKFTRSKPIYLPSHNDHVYLIQSVMLLNWLEEHLNNSQEDNGDQCLTIVRIGFSTKKQ